MWNQETIHHQRKIEQISAIGWVYEVRTHVELTNNTSCSNIVMIVLVRLWQKQQTPPKATPERTQIMRE
jgi:hypothetical protein